jgi:hypothetical protein
MVAPAVVQLIVTFWASLYVPAAGENVGVATLDVPPAEYVTDNILHVRDHLRLCLL